MSVEDGDKKESESIASQRQMLEGFVKQREDMVLTREYVDAGDDIQNFEKLRLYRRFDSRNHPPRNARQTV